MITQEHVKEAVEAELGPDMENELFDENVAELVAKYLTQMDWSEIDLAEGSTTGRVYELYVFAKVSLAEGWIELYGLKPGFAQPTRPGEYSAR